MPFWDNTHAALNIKGHVQSPALNKGYLKKKLIENA